MIILPHTNFSQGIILARKLRKVISDHDFSTVWHQSASFGVSSFVSGVSIEETIGAADKALYSSKSKGRNCVT